MTLGEWGAAGGLLTMLVAVAIVWYFQPRNGAPHRWVTNPYLEEVIPLVITTGLVLGFSAFVGSVATLLGG